MVFNFLTSALLCFQLLFATGSPDDQRNPALKLRVTRLGFDYANVIASETLNEKIRTLTLPNIRGDVNVSDIRITSFRPPAYFYSLSPPSTLSWGLDGAGIEFEAEVGACKRVVVNICKKVKVKVDIDNVTISMTTKFGRRQKGQPTLTEVDCRASIGNLDLKAKGGVIGWVINVFRTKVAKTLKPKFKHQLCFQAKKFLWDNVNTKLASFPVQTKLGRFFDIDYGLVADPVIDNNYVEISLKGSILQSSQAATSPYTPIQMPPSAIREDRMFYAWISDTVVNDLFYFGHHSNLTRFVLSQTTPVIGSYLKFNCDYKKKCLGFVLPELNNTFPRIESAEAILATTEPPLIFVNNNNSATFRLKGTIDLYPASSNSSEIDAAVDKFNQSIALSEIDLEANFLVKVEEMRLKAEVKISQLKIRVVESQLDFFTVVQLEAGLPMVVVPMLERHLNNRFSIGLPIPITKGAKLINPQIRLIERVVQVESDFEYHR